LKNSIAGIALNMCIEVLGDPHAVSKKLDYVEDEDVPTPPYYYRTHA